MDFARYPAAHRARLEVLAQGPAWQRYLADEHALAAYRAALRGPPSAPSQLRGALAYLVGRNGPRVQTLIAAGERDEETLVGALADWAPALAGDEPWPLLFLGLVLTMQCSFAPRCLYCNQAMLRRRLTLERWKALIAEAATPVPPYVYLTGGEALLLGAGVWGDDGLVAYATGLGCAVNLNTNAALITPRVALHLVKAGLARIHVSLDSPDPATQGVLFGGARRVAPVWRGLANIQIAREALGATHPRIHINCVLTRLNLFQFPALLRFLLDMRPLPAAAPGRKVTADPAFGDFDVHLIPVGGVQNNAIRPTASEWRRFYTETWAEAEQVWATYLGEIGVPVAERESLAAHVPFANPYLRADHHLSLDAYCEQAARGVYWQGALTARCHVAPSQAYVLPDGAQHWCGAHAVRRPGPVGNALSASLRENVRRAAGALGQLPGPDCINCAGATCVINQAIERGLRAQVAGWLQEGVAA